MRTKKNWEKGTKQKVLSKYFTPRIQRDLELYEQPKNIEKINQNLYLYGGLCTGKSLYIAQMLYNYIYDCYMKDLEFDFVWWDWARLIYELKLTFKADNSGNYKKIIERACSSKILFIDDLGTVRPNEWLNEVLYLIINNRYEYMRHTIITANYDLKQQEERLNDARIISKIKRSYNIVKKMHYKEIKK